jgi:chromosomal replication initiation ATPase DnaA
MTQDRDARIAELESRIRTDESRRAMLRIARWARREAKASALHVHADILDFVAQHCEREARELKRRIVCGEDK